MDGFDRRGFIRSAGVILAAGAVGAPPADTALARMFNGSVDETLFTNINRVKDPDKMTGLELHHVPQITLPERVVAGEPFMVVISVGQELHVTMSSHRILSITLMAGNEPVGTVLFESTFAQPKAAFLVALERPVTLVAQARCNLHGLWESSADVNPA